jgi:putative membrane protein
MQLTFPPKVSAHSEKPVAARQRRSDRIREHLANERTYLAWMRSAVSLMGFGVVIVRIQMLQPPMMPTLGDGWKLGLAFALVGLIMVWLSTQHYYAVRHDIDEDNFEPSDRWVALFSFAVLILGMGVVYYVFSVPLQTMTSYVFE